MRTPGAIVDEGGWRLSLAHGPSRDKLGVSRALAHECPLSGQASEQAYFLRSQPGVTVDCAHRQESCPTKLAPHAQGSPTTRSRLPFFARRHIQQAYSHLTARRATLLKRVSPRQYSQASALELTSLSLAAPQDEPVSPSSPSTITPGVLIASSLECQTAHLPVRTASAHRPELHI